MRATVPLTTQRRKKKGMKEVHGETDMYSNYCTPLHHLFSAVGDVPNLIDDNPVAEEEDEDESDSSSGEEERSGSEEPEEDKGNRKRKKSKNQCPLHCSPIESLRHYRYVDSLVELDTIRYWAKSGWRWSLYSTNGAFGTQL